MVAPAPPPLRRQIANGLAWSVLQSWGSRLLTFVIFVVLARLLTPEEFGTVTLAYVIFAALGTLPEAGLVDTLIRRARNEQSHLDTAFWFILGAAAVIYALAAACAPWLSQRLAQPRLQELMWVVGLTLPLVAAGHVHEAVLRRSMQFRPLAMRSLIATAVGGVVGIGLAFAGLGFWSLVAKGVVEAGVGTALLWRSSDYRPGFAISRHSGAELFAVSKHLMVSRVIDLANTRLDSLIVGARLGPAALGLYGAGQRIHLTLMEALFATVNRVTLPAFARLNTEPERMQSALLRLVALCSFFSFPLFAAVALSSQALIVTLFGERWEAASPILSAFALGGLLFSVSFFNAPVMTAAGRTGLVLTLTIVNASVNAAGFWFGSMYGVVGVALAYSLRGYIVLPLNVLFLRRSIGMNVAAYLRTLWPSLAATLVGFGLAWSLRQSEWLDSGLLVRTGVELAVALGVYLAVLLFLFPRRVMTVAQEIETFVPQAPRLSPHLPEWLRRHGGI